jgi:hypothetical protein
MFHLGEFAMPGQVGIPSQLPSEYIHLWRYVASTHFAITFGHQQALNSKHGTHFDLSDSTPKNKHYGQRTCQIFQAAMKDIFCHPVRDVDLGYHLYICLIKNSHQFVVVPAMALGV